jgi:hypothetical protein
MVLKGQPMNAPVIRISIGKFEARQAAVIEAKLRESNARLDGRIRAMKGNLAVGGAVQND